MEPARSKRNLGVRWARWTARRRRPILWSALLAGIVAAPIAARLPLRGDMSYLLPPQTTSVRDLHALEARAQVFGTIIVAIESDDAGRRAAAAQRVRDQLTALPAGTLLAVAADSAARDRFAWEHRHLLAPTEDLTAIRDELARRKARMNPLFVSLDDDADASPATAGPTLGDRLRDLQQQLDAAKAGAQHPTPLVSKDGRLQIIVARTPFASGEVSRNAPILAAVERAVADAREAAGPAVRFGITGDVVTNATEHRALLGGMLQATVFTMVIVALGMLLFFRSAAAVGALLGALTLGALVTFAFTRAVVGHLNLATAFLAPIVVGNGINFGIILLARYFEERRRTDDPAAALGAAVQGSIGGTLAAALTASVSYASLLATDFRGFRHFGLIGGVGILFCWVATFLVLPAALAALEARKLAAGRSPVRLGKGLAWLMPRRRPAIVVTALMALVGSGLCAWRYVASEPFEKDFRNLRSTGSEMLAVRRWNESIDRAFGRGISGGTVIALPSRDRARAVADRIRAADRARPAGERLFARVSTLDDLVPPDQDDRLALLADIRRLTTPAMLATLDGPDREAARALMPPARIARIADADVPYELAWPFIERDGTRGRLIMAMTGAGFDLWRTEDLERFVATFRGMGLGGDVVVGGNAFVQNDIVCSVNRDGPRSSLIAAAGAALVVILILGVSRQAVVTLLCGASGVFLLLSAASLLGIRINFLDFVALPITIGIGIDYSVNIAARHRTEGRGSAARILVAAGPAVALCSFTTVVGYASLLFSANQGIRSFGLAALIGEMTCIGAAVALAPALLDFRIRKPAAADVRQEGAAPPARITIPDLPVGS
jgi:predicted RND superfamily exporter protein